MKQFCFAFFVLLFITFGKGQVYPVNVALVTDDSSSRYNALKAELVPFFHSVTVVLTSTVLGPTSPANITYLKTFDALFFWTNGLMNSPSGTATILGNNFATYAGAGGAVVIAMKGFLQSTNQYLTGGFNPTYYTSTLSTSPTYLNGDAGFFPVDPEHPIFDNVNNGTFWAQNYYEVITPKAGSIVVANYTGSDFDGIQNVPLIVTRLIGSARRVDLNFFPIPIPDGEGAETPGYDPTTDVSILMANSIKWAIGMRVTSVYPTNVVEGASVTVTGFYFGVAPTLTLNGTIISYTYNTDTSIVFTAGDLAPGQWNLTVNSSNIDAGESTVVLTWSSAPYLYWVNPSTWLSETGGIITLGGKQFTLGGTPTVNVSWSNPQVSTVFPASSPNVLEGAPNAEYISACIVQSYNSTQIVCSLPDGVNAAPTLVQVTSGAWVSPKSGPGSVDFTYAGVNINVVNADGAGTGVTSALQSSSGTSYTKCYDLNLGSGASEADVCLAGPNTDPWFQFTWDKDYNINYVVLWNTGYNTSCSGVPCSDRQTDFYVVLYTSATTPTYTSDAAGITTLTTPTVGINTTRVNVGNQPFYVVHYNPPVYAHGLIVISNAQTTGSYFEFSEIQAFSVGPEITLTITPNISVIFVHNAVLFTVTAAYKDISPYTPYSGTLDWFTSPDAGNGNNFMLVTPFTNGVATFAAVFPNAGNFSIYAWDNNNPQINGSYTLNAGIDVKISGDPHFVGFGGRKYDVNGEGGHYYNLWTEEDFQMNARFAKWWCNRHSTVIVEIGLQWRGHQIYFDSHFNFTVDGKRLGINERYDIDIPNKVRAILDSGIAMKTWTPQGTFRIAPVGISAHCPLLDTEIFPTLVADSHPIHGLLGQTHNHHHTQAELEDHVGPQGEGEIEGVYTDYEVSNLWGKDFKFNLYKY